MLIFLVMFVLYLSVLSLMVNNLVVWWSIFLMMTLIFIILNKSVVSYSSLFNYFVLQESLGLLFLLMTFGYVQLLILLMKVGVAPLHFWVFNVMNGVYGYNLMWFLTFQKLPFLLILLQMMVIDLLYLMILGLLVCMMQMLLVKSYKNLLILSSTESFNWIIVGLMLFMFNVLLIFIYYIVLMIFIIPKYEKVNFKNYLGWETVLIFMNLPFSVNFFVKIFALAELMKFYSLGLLFLLFMMFMSMLSLGYWLVVLSVKNAVDEKYNKIVYLMVSMMLVILV